jgi:predicted DNA-binding transcriptional regulator AlpA
MPDQLSAEISLYKILSTAEAAAFLNFSVPHFRRLYRSCGVPAPMQLSTRKLGWKIGDLIDWVTARQSRLASTPSSAND